MSVGHDMKKRKIDEEDSVLPTPPDGGWGWMVVFGSFMIHIITDGVTYSFGVFYNEFLTYFQEGKAATAWILSILVGVTLCSGPISSALVNKWGCRIVTIAGSIIGSICLALSIVAPNVTTLYFTIGIGAGFGFGLIYLPAIVSVTTYFEKRRSLATGIAVCGSGFGTFVFAPLITYLLSEFGWRGAMLIIAGIVLECIIFGAFFRPLIVKKEKNHIAIKSVNANTDLHTSDVNLHHLSISNGNGQMHRPRSVDHVAVSVRGKQEINQNMQNGKHQQDLRLALSQPMLAQRKHSLQRQQFGSQSFRKYGPLNRPDIFYQGSLKNIRSYRSHLDLENREETPFLGHKRSSLVYRRRTSEASSVDVLCPEARSTLKEMLDFSLFKDSIFLLFVISNFLTSVGFNVPYVYIVPKAVELDISSEEAGMLLSIIGIANTIGRISLGYISDKSWVNRLFIYSWCLILCGIGTIFSAFCPTFYALAAYAVFFGFTIGAYVGLTSVILVDLLGLERLTSAFGVLLLFQGAASLIGPPMAGALYDLTFSYDYGFYLAGITICLSGLVLFIIPPIQRHREKHQTQNPATL